jgi:hypothetical protein
MTPLTRWRVSFASGLSLVVVASDAELARKVGAYVHPRDEIVEVRAW